MAAVGAALAAATAATFSFVDPSFSGIVTGIPTFLLGLVWAWALGFPQTVGKSKLRWGWVLSVPLAAANGALAAGLLLAMGSSQDVFDPRGFLFGAALGATFGVFVWVPALAATLVAFGLPIAYAQNQAQKGLAGAERGEKIVGAVCAALAVAALSATLRDPVEHPGIDHLVNKRETLVAAGVVLTRAMAALAVVAGGLAAGLASRREALRRTFVAEVEQGKVPGFRVDATSEGKALVRVSSLGQGYRVSDFAEELYLLDEEGAATESRTAELR